MKLLLSNDDGYFAKGLQQLLKALCEHNDYLFSEMLEDICVIAPERNRSASSNSLTLLSPLRMQEHRHDCSLKKGGPRVSLFSVDGTPTDCVHLGVNGALGYQPDIVVSGINAGANLGDDVIYSGTVAAATEGRFLGKPSVAISLCGDRHFETAAKVFMDIFSNSKTLPLSANTILNINVPDVPYKEIKGIKVTRLGKRHASEPVVVQRDPRGNKIHWIGPAGEAADASTGTDFHAIENNYVSITPLMIDLTNYSQLLQLDEWLES